MSGAKFCRSCGASIRTETRTATIVCDQCRYENAPNAKFCRQCGISLASVPSVASDLSVPPSIHQPEAMRAPTEQVGLVLRDEPEDAKLPAPTDDLANSARELRESTPIESTETSLPDSDGLNQPLPPTAVGQDRDQPTESANENLDRKSFFVGTDAKPAEDNQNIETRISRSDIEELGPRSESACDDSFNTASTSRINSHGWHLKRVLRVVLPATLVVTIIALLVCEPDQDGAPRAVSSTTSLSKPQYDAANSADQLSGPVIQDDANEQKLSGLLNETPQTDALAQTGTAPNSIEADASRTESRPSATLMAKITPTPRSNPPPEPKPRPAAKKNTVPVQRSDVSLSCASLEGLSLEKCKACSDQPTLKKFICEQRVSLTYCQGRWGSEPGCPKRKSEGTMYEQFNTGN